MGQQQQSLQYVIEERGRVIIPLAGDTGKNEKSLTETELHLILFQH